MLPELNTSRLTLSELSLEDGPALQAYQQLPDNWRLQAVEPGEYTDGKRIERYLKHRGEGGQRRLHVFVAREPSNHQLVGEVGISRTYLHTAAIGFSIVPQQWGKGYATEVAERVLAFGFCELGVHRITAAVAIENAASCRVLEKIGMTHEGISRECIYAQGRWWSEHQYAVLKTDHGMQP